MAMATLELVLLAVELGMEVLGATQRATKAGRAVTDAEILEAISGSRSRMDAADKRWEAAGGGGPATEPKV